MRTTLLAESETKTLPLASQATPHGPLKMPLKPAPSA
jgi:hypothetical protein